MKVYGDLIDSWICSIDTGDPEQQRELLRAVQQ